MKKQKKTHHQTLFHPVLHNLSKEFQTLAELGIERMKQSKDPMHTVEHIKELFDLYKQFRKKIFRVYKLSKSQENAVLLALIWHDVYKATQKHPNNAFYFLYDQAVEGKLSANIFLKTAAKTPLPKEIIEMTVHAIKYHATLALWTRRASKKWNQVADIILDLDTVENMNVSRLRRAAEKSNPFYLLDYWFSYYGMRIYTRYLAKKKYRFPFIASLAKSRAEEFLNTLPDLRVRSKTALNSSP